MARAIEIAIASETGAFAKGIQTGIIQPTEDAQRVLEELGREKPGDGIERSIDKADRALDDLGRNTAGDKLKRSVDKADDALDDLGRTKAGDQIERAMKDAEKATERLSDEIDETAKNIDKSFRESYKDLKKSADDGYDGVREAGAEFKDEAKSNFSEITSSFDGSMESIRDMAQGTLGGLAASDLPGVGIAAGLAALAIGGIASAIGANEEEMAASRERAAEWAGAYIDAGSQIIDSSYVVAEVQAIATDPERYKIAGENATNWGVDVSTAMRAMAGDTDALAVVQQSLSTKTDEYNSIIDDMKSKSATGAADLRGLTAEQRALRGEITNGTNAFDKLTSEMSEGQKIAKNVSDALIQLGNDSEDATVQVDDLGNKMVTLPDGMQFVVDAQTGRASQKLDTFKGDVATLPKERWLTVSTSTNFTEFWRNYNSLPRQHVVNTVVRPGQVQYW